MNGETPPKPVDTQAMKAQLEEKKKKYWGKMDVDGPQITVRGFTYDKYPNPKETLSLDEMRIISPFTRGDEPFFVFSGHLGTEGEGQEPVITAAYEVKRTRDGNSFYIKPVYIADLKKGQQYPGRVERFGSISNVLAVYVPPKPKSRLYAAA